MAKVTKDMSIIDIVQNHPETLEAGAKVHGFDADAMVTEINALLGE
ncbi:MAG: hypothetical protein Q4E87_01435 [bacterium]|nr:hypothetical protein [bacterium]